MSPQSTPWIFCGALCFVPFLVAVVTWVTLQGFAARRIRLHVTGQKVEGVNHLNASLELEERRPRPVHLEDEQ